MKWRDYVIPPAFQKKATDIHKAIVQIMGLDPQWTPRDYENFAKEGFNANVWVYRCIMAIAQGGAGVPWLLYQKQNNGELKEITKHELLNLLNRPNEFQSRGEFIESLIAFILISGNSYIHMNGPTVGAPRELWLWRPDRVKVIPHTNRFVAAYQYEVGEKIVKYDAKVVSHLKFFNPLNDFYGLSPIEVAARGIDNDNAANAWNNALLNNGTRPSGALITEEHLTDPQYDNLKKELDAQYKGTKNAGKPLLLEGGLKWQEMGLNPKDMDFINSKRLSRIEICTAFGVPPEIIGDSETKTYSNYQEARRALYEDAIIPMLDRIRDKLNSDLVPLFGDNLYLSYNKDEIEALQENRDAVYKRANESYKSGLLSKNEARQELGYEVVEGGDEFYEEPTPISNEPKKSDKNDDFFLNKKAFNLEGDEQKTFYWKSMDRRRNAYNKRIAEKIAERFKAEKKAVLKAFNDGGINEIDKAINQGQKDWQKLFVAIYVEVMRDFGEQLFNNLKAQAVELEIKAPDIPLEDAFDVFDDAVQSFIANTVARKVVQVTDTTKAKIRSKIAAGEAEGESIVELAERIDTLYLDQIIPNRSTVIARTEVIAASNAGNRYAAKQTGLELQKEWIATRDDRTRDTHEDLDGEKRNMDDEYSNRLLFPGDPSGEAEEVIQCRCTEGYNVIK